MFDATNGERVFEGAYEKALATENPEMWYACGYCIWECWSRAALDAIESLPCEDVTDLMAYVLDPEDAHKAFCDGFTYLLGQMMEDKYEGGRE